MLLLSLFRAIACCFQSLLLQKIPDSAPGAMVGLGSRPMKNNGAVMGPQMLRQSIEMILRDSRRSKELETWKLFER